MKKNRITAIFLALAMLVALTACGSTSGSASGSAAASTTSEDTDVNAASTVETPEAPEAEVSGSSVEAELSAVEPEEIEPYEYELPLTDEEASFSIFSMSAPPFLATFLGDGQSYNTAESTLYLYDLTGIRIEYQEVDMFSFAEKLSLMTASGDYTDMISSVAEYYVGGCTKAYDDEVIIDITEYVENNMPALSQIIEQQGLEKELANDDGQYLAIQNINSDDIINQGGIIRQDYLDSLGLDIPQTYDDLYEAGMAIKNNYTCKSVFYFDNTMNPGVSFTDGFDLPGFDISGGTDLFYQVDGNVQAVVASDNMKEYITMVAKWYVDGLISPDFFNNTQQGLRESFEAGECAICWDGADTITTHNSNPTLMESGFDSTGIPLTTREEGQMLHITPATKSRIGTDGVCITPACEDVALLTTFLDFMFTEPAQLLVNYGLEGESYVLDDDGVPQWTEAMYPTAERTYLQSSATYLLNSIPSVVDVFAADTINYDDEARAAHNLWMTGYDSAYDFSNAVTLTVEENESYTAIITDINTYAGEYLMGCFTGEVDIDATWDEYIDKLTDMGLDTCIEIQQAAYDRYTAR